MSSRRESCLMPYIVTTTRPGTKYLSAEPDVAPTHDSPAVSRRTVATLEGKHLDPFWRESGIDPRSWNEATLGCLRLPEQGGTVGPLPDGTVIEVETLA
jgi:hypothetical protein